MSKYKKVRLVGGTNDGVMVDALYSEGWLQPMIYIAKKLSSLEEVDNLIIDNVTRWKWPEEVYVRNKNEEYVFSKEVHYKPD